MVKFITNNIAELYRKHGVSVAYLEAHIHLVPVFILDSNIVNRGSGLV
jgi:hypothetical protein